MIDKNKMIEVSKNIIKNNGLGTVSKICKGVRCDECVFSCYLSNSKEELVKKAKIYLEDNEIYFHKFSWQSFKQGEIEVNCTTERSARDFLKQCDKKGILWSGGTKIDDNTSWHNNKENTLYSTINGNLVFGYKLSTDNKAIIWNIKENVNMNSEKTFKEVIADIKEGEVWESEKKTITYFNKRIEVTDTCNNVKTMCFHDSMKYKLQKKEYTFTEAFAAYEEGKEIESLYDSETFLKEHEVIEGHDNWFDAKQIRNKWYINN